MVEIYVSLVRSGRKTLDEVPEALRSAVEARIAELA